MNEERGDWCGYGIWEITPKCRVRSQLSKVLMPGRYAYSLLWEEPGILGFGASIASSIPATGAR